ncbi:MAG TPA: Holliday junction branch migration protein RuvA [Pseudomonadales bacterium]|jgi:Holliday junction DNA helicase RuvA|nr:Holliday junction branch migration protein RuvA [Gammaproteobacteria bacterium]HIM35321.1 Holliday junction branch migration protein RuvA [Pseudomonadales bacterium]|tara:strand:- start:5822 stop:6412 length:591 start_codon:yes stop_codon:yes gene_type:complete
MISRLRGRVVNISDNVLIIDVQGVAYEAEVTGTTLATVAGHEGEVDVYTHLVVRDDTHALFGFASLAERELFRALIKVNGIGPKLGLTLLSSLTPEQFATSVADQDVAAMTRVPGVGKKTAERLLMELKDRLDTLPVGITRGATNKESTAREAELALVSLGYRPLDAARAIDNVYAAGEPVEELIRMALQRMTTNA